MDYGLFHKMDNSHVKPRNFCKVIWHHEHGDCEEKVVIYGSAVINSVLIVQMDWVHVRKNGKHLRRFPVSLGVWCVVNFNSVTLMREIHLKPPQRVDFIKVSFNGVI